jgi:GTP cyclohydrolase II
MTAMTSNALQMPLQTPVQTGPLTVPAAIDALAPTLGEQIARAVSDLRAGRPCLAVLGQHMAVIVAVEAVSQDRLSALQSLFDAPELVLTDRRARAVLLPAAAAQLAAAPVRIRPPEGASFAWLRARADAGFDSISAPATALHVLHGGDLRVHRLALALVKSAELLPAALIFELPNGDAVPAVLDLCRIETVPALDHFAAAPDLSPVSAATFPLQAAKAGELTVFRDRAGMREHYALKIGTPDLSQPVLARLHSACFTGDVLGSLKCDCGPQLHAALAQMGAEGAGILLYLNQEGRGIGLANKMRVYDLQTQGLDTVDANHRLGFEDDERDFRVAAVMMKTMGVRAARLLTNNPAKVRVFAAHGVEITEQVPLRVGRNAHNSDYLATKARKSGHAL